MSRINNLFWLSIDKIDGLRGGAGFVSDEGGAGNVLKNLNSAIKEKYGINSDPRSIPHPWARSILAERCVLMNKSTHDSIASDDEKRFVKGMIGRWRGCLALIALAEVYGLNLSYKKMQNMDQIGESIQAMRPKASVANMIVSTIDDNTDDYIIYSEHEPIAITSPTTGITPGFVLGKNCDKKYPWVIADEFTDPVSKMTRGEKLIVYAWLQQFIIYLKDKKGAVSNKDPKIIEALENYQRDLGLTQSDKALADTASKNTASIRGVLNSPYSAFDKRIILNSSSYSEAIIKETNICVVDENIDEVTIGDETLLVGLLDARMYIRNKPIFNKFVPDGKEIIILGSTDIFTDDCFGFAVDYFDKDDSNIKGIDVSNSVMGIDANTHVVNEGFNDSENRMKYACILPIEIKAAKLLKEKVVSDMVKITALSDRISTEIGFTLDNGGNITIKKNYKLGDTLHELPESNVPTVAIWPNIPNCKYYYMNSKWGESIDNAFIFAPVDEEIVQNSGSSLYNDVYSFSTDKYPVLLRCYRHNPETRRLEHVGIVKTKALPELAAMTMSGYYSLDFGTSSTVAAYRLSTDTSTTAREINFENQVSVITTSVVSAKDINKLMLGVYAVRSPFPTIYLNKSGRKVSVLQGGHPYFAVPGKRLAWDDNRLTSNIKFTHSGDATIVNIQKDYIRTVVCMMMVHAAKHGINSIELRFSYPISIKNISNFKNGIINEMIGVQNQAPFPVALANTGAFITESEAAARFFSNKVNGLKNSLTIDIGGGSVDVFAFTQLVNGTSAMISSIVKGSRFILLDSLRYATDLFADAIRQIRKQYAEDDSALADEIVESKFMDNQTFNNLDGSEYHTTMEILLLHNFTIDGMTKNLGDEISNIFRRASGVMANSDNSKRVRALYTVWLFWLSSFFYYGALMYKKSWQNVANENEQMLAVQIFLSGRGSNLVDWIPVEINEFLLNIAKKAIKKDNVVMKMNRNDKKERKLESAKGMLLPALKASVDGAALDSNSFVLDYIPGEKLVDKEGNVLDEYTLIKSSVSNSNEAISASECISDIVSDFPVFNDFLDAYSDTVHQFNLEDSVYKVHIGEDKSKTETQRKEYISINANEFKTHVQTYKVEMATGSTDEPVFAALTDIVGKMLVKHVAGKGD